MALASMAAPTLPLAFTTGLFATTLTKFNSTTRPPRLRNSPQQPTAVRTPSAKIIPNADSTTPASTVLALASSIAAITQLNIKYSMTSLAGNTLSLRIDVQELNAIRMNSAHSKPSTSYNARMLLVPRALAMHLTSISGMQMRLRPTRSIQPLATDALILCAQAMTNVQAASATTQHAWQSLRQSPLATRQQTILLLRRMTSALLLSPQ